MSKSISKIKQVTKEKRQKSVKSPPTVAKRIASVSSESSVAKKTVGIFSSLAPAPESSDHIQLKSQYDFN